MTTKEKIANAKQRILELEQLIKYWDNSINEKINSKKIQTVNFDLENKKFAA